MRPGANHVDRQRRLLPRDYLSPPDAFGLDPDADVVLPDGGDEVSRNHARVQHQLVLRWRRNGRRPSSTRLGEIYGFSKMTMSRTVGGHRWMGEAVGLALFHAATEPLHKR